RPRLDCSTSAPWLCGDDDELLLGRQRSGVGGTRIEVMRDRANVVGLHGSSGFALAATGGRAKAARPAAFFIALRASLPAMAATRAAAVGRVRRYRLTTRGRGEGWPNRSQGAPGNRLVCRAQPVKADLRRAPGGLTGRHSPAVSRRLASLQQSSRTGDACEFFTTTASQPWRKAIAAATDQPVRPTMEDHL